MRRRDFLGGAITGAALVPFGAAAQPGVPVIGYLSSRSPEARTYIRSQAEFLEELEQAGFVVDRNIAIEYWFAEGRVDRLPMLAAHHRIPAVYEWREFVDASGLMSYSPDRRELVRVYADYAGRILKGAKPADLPVEQPIRFELVVNIKTAQALGLTIPQSILARADEVIE
jgi:hypothetical protein